MSSLPEPKVQALLNLWNMGVRKKHLNNFDPSNELGSNILLESNQKKLIESVKTSATKKTHKPRSLQKEFKQIKKEYHKIQEGQNKEKIKSKLVNFIFWKQRVSTKGSAQLLEAKETHRTLDRDPLSNINAIKKIGIYTNEHQEEDHGAQRTIKFYRDCAI